MSDLATPTPATPPAAPKAPPARRLDALLREGGVRTGTRFLYCVGGVSRGGGKLYEGVLLEESSGGHVRLNESGCWDWPGELFVQEILPPRAASAPAAAATHTGQPAPDTLPRVWVPTPAAAKSKTTKPPKEK